MDQTQTRMAAAIKAARQKAELTQEELAEAIGLTVDAVAHMETGRRNPSFSTMTALNNRLDLDISRVFATKDSGAEVSLKRAQLEEALAAKISDLTDDRLEALLAVTDTLRDVK